MGEQSVRKRVAIDELNKRLQALTEEIASFTRAGQPTPLPVVNELQEVLHQQFVAVAA